MGFGLRIHRGGYRWVDDVDGVDNEPFLANRHKASSIPLLLFYDAQGNLVKRQEGMLQEEELKKELEKIGVS